MFEERSSRIGEILIEEGLITQEQLFETLQIQKDDPRRLGEILVEKGFIKDQQVARILAELYKLPFIELSLCPIKAELFNIVPLEICNKYMLVPVEIDDRNLVVATNNPLDFQAVQEVQYLSGFSVRPVVASRQEIKNFLDRAATIPMSSAYGIKTDQANAPILKLVENILANAIQERASDIHFEPMEDKLRVRYRIDGVLYEKSPISKDLERRVISRIKIIGGMDVADTRRPQDGRISMPGKLKDYDIRVSTLPDIIGENVVLRILNKHFVNLSFTSLGLDKAKIDMVQKLIQRPHGMILVTGPTGSGKTTTLYSMLSQLNQSSRNIITVEDPVEYRIPGINQTIINNRAGYTFATAIRSILRHDPNIIMVGEIRDMETAEIAIRAALTGHLVLSTLHTNTAAGAVMRLLDMKIEPFLIRSALIGVVAQRLVRRLCQHCKQAYEPSEEVKTFLEPFVPSPLKVKLASAVGCDKCYRTGYSGREAIFEILSVNEGIRNLILRSPNEQDIMRQGIAQGMKTLRQAGVEKALQQVTTLEEVMHITSAEGE